MVHILHRQITRTLSAAEANTDLPSLARCEHLVNPADCLGQHLPCHFREIRRKNLQTFFADHALFKIITVDKLVEGRQGRDGRQQCDPTKFLTMPVDAKVEDDRYKPGPETDIMPGPVPQQSVETILRQLLADK